jgi:hypothetical protein
VAAVLGWGGPAYVAPYALAGVSDPVAKATVASAFVALFGVVFVAIFSEISSYYKDRERDILEQQKQKELDIVEQRRQKELGMQRKWELIFPMLRDYYNPWIQAAAVFSGYLNAIKSSDSFSEERATHVLFYVSLFFGKRLWFSLNAGGRPILAQDTDEETVMSSYKAVEKSLDWTEDEDKKRKEVSFLQRSFIKKDRNKEDPYVYETFASDLEKDAKMQEIRDEIKAWLTKDHVEKTAKALDEFQSKFKDGINKLYSGWSA